MGDKELLSGTIKALGAAGSYTVGQKVAQDKDKRRREQRKRERFYENTYRKRHKK